MTRAIRYTSLLMVLLAMMLSSHEAQAAFNTSDPVYIAAAGCSNYADTGITLPIIICMTQITNAVVNTYIGSIAPQLHVAFVILCSIAVALLGIRVALGALPAGRAKTDALILSMKIICISYFVFQYGVIEYVGLINRISAAVAESGLNAMIHAGLNPFSADIVRGQSFSNQYTGTLSGEPAAIPTITTVSAIPSDRPHVYVPPNLQIPGGPVPWVIMDTTFKRVLGFLGTPSGMFSAVVGISLLVVGLMFTGYIGAFITMMAFAVFMALVVAFVMPLYVYVTTMIGTMILVAIAPIILPLLLFKDIGYKMAMAWIKQIISYSMQPMFLSLFLVFALTLLGNVFLDLTAIYEEAKTTIEDPSVKNNIQILGMDETTNNCAEESKTSSFVSIAYKYIGSKLLAKVQSAVASFVRGVLNLFVDMFALMWPFDRTLEFMIILLTGFLLLMIMITFQIQLPGMITDIIGEGDKTLTNFAETAFHNIQSVNMSIQGSVANRSTMGQGKKDSE